MTDPSTPPRANFLVTFDPKAVRIGPDRPGYVCLSHEGQEIKVKPVRNFPLTDPDHYISLLDEDDNDIGLLKDPSDLDVESRNALQTQLDQSYFLPRLTKIVRIREEFSVYRWEVETDKGERTFEVRGRDDVRWVSGGHIIVRDIDGNRYHIPNLSGLDAESRVQVDLLL